MISDSEGVARKDQVSAALIDATAMRSTDVAHTSGEMADMAPPYALVARRAVLDCTSPR